MHSRSSALLLAGTLLVLAGCQTQNTGTKGSSSSSSLSAMSASSGSSDMTIDLPQNGSDMGQTSSMGTDQSVVIEQHPDREEARPGAELGYTLMIRNAGDTVLRNLELEDAFPVGKLSVVETRGGTVGEDRVTWQIDELQPHEVRNIRIDMQVNSTLATGDTLLNIVTVRGAGAPVTSANEVKVVGRLPRTGAGFTGDLEKTSSYLQPIR